MRLRTKTGTKTGIKEKSAAEAIEACGLVFNLVHVQRGIGVTRPGRPEQRGNSDALGHFSGVRSRPEGDGR